MLNQVKSASRRSVIVLLCLALIWSIAALAPGIGVQYRLNVRDGTDSDGYRASLLRASERMSPAQRTAYNWAVSSLDSEALISRYGVTPTPREVIVGEVSRVVDEKRRQIAVLEKKLANQKDLVAESERRRREMILELSKTYSPQVIEVSYADVAPGVEDEDVAEDGGLFLWYRIENPKAKRISILPCRATFRSNSTSLQQSREFDCLANRAPNGHYFLRLSRGAASNVGAEATIQPDYENALWLSNGQLSRVVQDTLFELAELRAAKAEMSYALGYKASL